MEQKSRAVKVRKLLESIEAKVHYEGRLAARREAQQSVTNDVIMWASRARDALTRRRAAHLASFLPLHNALEFLARVLREDECPVVRHEAAFLLGTLESEDAVDALVAAVMSDKDPLVRHEAAEALGDMVAISAKQDLKAALSDPSDAVRRTATIALRQLEEKYEA